MLMKAKRYTHNLRYHNLIVLKTTRLLSSIYLVRYTQVFNIKWLLKLIQMKIEMARLFCKIFMSNFMKIFLKLFQV
jgi:hypothetical protein